MLEIENIYPAGHPIAQMKNKMTKNTCEHVAEAGTD